MRADRVRSLHDRPRDPDGTAGGVPSAAPARQPAGPPVARPARSPAMPHVPAVPTTFVRAAWRAPPDHRDGIAAAARPPWDAIHRAADHHRGPRRARTHVVRVPPVAASRVPRPGELDAAGAWRRRRVEPP